MCIIYNLDDMLCSTKKFQMVQTKGCHSFYNSNDSNISRTIRDIEIQPNVLFWCDVPHSLFASNELKFLIEGI